MKRFAILITALILPFYCFSQHAVQLQNLWQEPQVHVLFQGYTVSFTIRDINRALELLAETGDSTYGITSKLDTAKQYAIELYPGFNTDYHNPLQPLLQKGVGTFLLSIGHAVIENHKHKKLKAVMVDLDKPVGIENVLDTKFYDPDTGKLLFSGQMAGELYGKDMGIDYY